VVVSPRRGPTDIQAYYRDAAVVRAYIERRTAQPLNGLLHRRQVTFLNDILRERQPARVLEVAPAPARLTAELDLAGHASRSTAAPRCWASRANAWPAATGWWCAATLSRCRSPTTASIWPSPSASCAASPRRRAGSSMPDAFSLLSAAAGGALIGVSASALLWLNGRIAGISGIAAGLVTPRLVVFVIALAVGLGFGQWLLDLPWRDAPVDQGVIDVPPF
jgi:hypothetical protein